LGCSTPVDPNYLRMLEPTGDAPPSANTLGAGDRIAIRVYNEEGLGGEFVVSPSGTINFPLTGKLQVDGMTCSGVEDELTHALREGYLRRPSVSCSVVEFNSKKIYVFGEVKRPGTFRFDDNMTVVQAVTLAGGFSTRASPNKTTVVRKLDGRKVRVRVPIDAIIEGEVGNLSLQPGDILFVPESLY
ncbi:MAG: polysaccharide biosynthesis/export family protein, partial [Myxococcota bacterium]